MPVIFDNRIYAKHDLLPLTIRAFNFFDPCLRNDQYAGLARSLDQFANIVLWQRLDRHVLY